MYNFNPEVKKKNTQIKLFLLNPNNYIFLILSIFLIFIFIQANEIGGHTWDEKSYLLGFNKLLENINNSSYENLGPIYFYGWLPVAPAVYINKLYPFIDVNFLLHLNAYLYFMGTCLVINSIIKKEYPNFSKLENFLLIIFFVNLPSILGHSFFNFKDLPLMFFYLLGIKSVLYLEQSDPANFRKFILIFFVSILGAMMTKFLALGLFLPHFIYIFIKSAQNIQIINRKNIVYALFSLILLMCLVTLSYPQSWNSPINFFIENINFMSNHPWGGCMIYFGSSLCPSKDDFISINYLIKVLFLKLPIYLIFFMLINFILSAAQRKVNHYYIFLFTPLLLISLKNSPLYDGIRHVIFIIPVLFLIFVATLYHYKNSNFFLFKIFFSFTIFLNLIILFDNIKLFPYNYIYVNEVYRSNLSNEHLDNDYWGYALKELSLKYKPDNNLNYKLILQPPHLIKPFLKMPKTQIKNEEFYIKITYSRSQRKIEKNCQIIESVKRKLVFTDEIFTLGYILKCNNES